ncbi:cytosine permease [Pseudonocardiaceae bacterium YIM PH 21723]|nr:cytosine permease [Pseudonocardiaceae bacterium YIM PH 21723]
MPAAQRRGLGSVAAVWAGFPMILTCAVFGGLIVNALGWWPGVAAIVAGNVVLMLYAGSMSVLAARTGQNFALLAVGTFGSRGYMVPTVMLATMVVGWFAFQTGLTGAVLHDSLGWPERTTALLAGIAFLLVTLFGIRALAAIGALSAPLFLVLGVVALSLSTPAADWQFRPGTGALSFGAAVTLVVATFVDAGTMAADFSRWARDGRSGFLAVASAFPVAYTIALLIGGLVAAWGQSSGDFLPILVGAGGVLVPIAVLFALVNLGSVCAHSLYNGAIGWGQLTGLRMRTLTVVLGVIGIAAAVAGVWNHFPQWLTLLGVLVPPIGIVILLDRLRPPRHTPGPWRPASLLAWGIGAAAALTVHLTAPWLSDALIAMAATAVVFPLLRRWEERR